MWQCLGYRLGLKTNINIVGFPNTPHVLLVVVPDATETVTEAATCWVVDVANQGLFENISTRKFVSDVAQAMATTTTTTTTSTAGTDTPPIDDCIRLTRAETIVRMCKTLIHSYAATDGNASDNRKEHCFADLICDLLNEDEKDTPPPQPLNANRSTLQPPSAVRHYHTSAHRTTTSTPPTPPTATALFSVPLQHSTMSTMNAELNQSLTDTAYRLYNKCWTSVSVLASRQAPDIHLSLFPLSPVINIYYSYYILLFFTTFTTFTFYYFLLILLFHFFFPFKQQVPKHVLEESLLSGGWRTAANVMFFRQQVEYSKQTKYASHLPSFERSTAFQTMVKGMRAASVEYLDGMYRRPTGKNSICSPYIESAFFVFECFLVLGMFPFVLIFNRIIILFFVFLYFASYISLTFSWPTHSHSRHESSR